MLTLGVIGTSKKENERRMPIHPDHLRRLLERYRRQLIFERGYGTPFGLSDAEIASKTGGCATRGELLADADAVVLPKPVCWKTSKRSARMASCGAGRTVFNSGP